MNRRYILLCFLVLTMTAFGQKANPYLCQLEEYFKNQDRLVLLILGIGQRDVGLNLNTV